MAQQPRLEAYMVHTTAPFVGLSTSWAKAPVDAEPLSLGGALAFAQANSAEYSGAEEQYLLVALSLIVQEHLFEPRMYNTTTFDVDYVGKSRYETSTRVANDFGVR